MNAEGRTFRRSLSIRILNLLTTLFLAGAVVTRLAAGELGVGLWIIALLAVLSLIGLVGAWGDRVRLDEEGVEAWNGFWSLLRLPRRRLAWRDVVAVREHRRLRPGGGEAPVSALFLVPRSGRRLVLDSLQDFDEARAMVARLFPRASPDACFSLTQTGRISTPPSDRPR